MNASTARLNYEMIISLVLICGTIVGTTVPLYLSGNKQIQTIQQEMKDFHGKLERQDAEFKGRLALQDAEFKAGMLLIEERMRARG